MRPILTVVVIVYNDARRLPRAVSSVLRQTLRDLEVVVVDDASLDGSAEVAERLATGHQGRVRVVRLPANSGGCSRPRNAGVEAARGEYVMFLDSDDELPRQACARLVETAEREQADFVAGLCHRVHVGRGGAVSPWYSWLYTQEVTYTSILENPGLLYDTLSTNKCYRRSFLDDCGLRFPEGYHYEDLLFSGEAYLFARRFSLVPDVVYRWNVYDDDETPSISNRRSELSNFEDRLRIHRLLDAAFTEHGAIELKLHKDVKFLRHDLVLYLRDLPWREPAYRHEFLDLAADYLNSLDPRAFDRVHPVQAIAGWFVRRRDEPNLFSAIDYVAHGQKLTTPLVMRDDRVYWTADHLDSAATREMLDVTELGFQDRPLADLRLAAKVRELSLDGTRLRLTGDVVNPLGRISSVSELTAELRLTPRRRRARAVVVQLAAPDHHGTVISWAAEVDLAAALHAIGYVDRVWDIRLRLVVDGERVEAAVTAAEPSWDGLAAPVRPLLGGLAADHVQTLVTPLGDLGLQFVPCGTVARTVHRAGRRITTAPTTRRARGVARRVRAAWRDPRHPRLLEEVFRRTLPRLPAGRPTVVFESDRGTRCGGDPKAVYQEMVRRGLALDAVWVHQGDPTGFPAGARLVRHGSLRYYTALATAQAWVEDVGVPREAAKRPGTVYVRTGNGSPVDWVGYDSVAMRRASNDDRLGLRRRVDKWDVVVVRSPYEEDTLARAFRHNAFVLRTGAPRNDRLVRPDRAAEAATRDRLAVGGAAVVLFVPSCDRAVVAPSVDLLAEGQRLVVWAPDASAATPPGARNAAHMDLAELLAVADVLVTEHHPSMLDFPLLRRPVLRVGCRCEVRGERPAAYLDVDREVPGPVVWEGEALSAELSDLAALSSRTAAALDVAAQRFGAYDLGQAAAAVVDEVQRRWASSPADVVRLSGRR